MEGPGKFVISLDFELLWGVRDKKTIENYGENISGVWEVLPKKLALFQKYRIKATFATVGFLFASNKDEITSYIPLIKPEYKDKNLSPYNGHFELVSDSTYQYHFADSLIELLKKYPDQEISTHTFSHYYCLEKGQDEEAFREDLKAAIAIANAKNVELESIVFPRNQFNENYLKVLKELDIKSYRGNEEIWFYKIGKRGQFQPLKRMLRIIDAYLKISGSNCHPTKNQSELPVDIPSSRLLRPYSKKLKYFENLRLLRIKQSMTKAAKDKTMYHLWWHPHNFGTNQKENLDFLEKILKHYQFLNKKYGFQSITMKELSNQLYVEQL